MIKKILSFCLAAIIFTLSSGINVFAQTGNLNPIETVAKQEVKNDARDLKSSIKAQSDAENQNASNKTTLADYEKAKKQGKKFSTTTKVLIGVGVAAAVIGIVVFAASRDKVKTF